MYNDATRRQLVAEEKEKIKDSFKRKLKSFADGVNKSYTSLKNTVDEKKFPLRNSVSEFKRLNYALEYQNALTCFNSEKVNYIRTLEDAMKDGRADFFFTLFRLLIESDKLPTAQKFEIEDVFDNYCALLNIPDYQKEIYGLEVLMQKAEIYMRTLETNPFEDFNAEADKKISAFLISKFDEIDKLK
jgi:hypothetical protein